MSNFRIQLKQGSRTYVERGEFKSLNHVLTFYNTLCTCKVSEIWGGAGYKDDTTPPIDDMQYIRMVKTFARHYETKKSVQITIRNVKPTKNTADIATMIKECMEIDGLTIDSIENTLFKRSLDD